MSQAALSGWRRALVERIERPIARRTPFSAETVRTAIGAASLALAVRRVARALRAGFRG
ncbi:MAG TPA: hypothetical protein VM290_03230 [Gaiellaceae bacterium]|nr:hypothetical protein [Gaiellaceae bacterium]